MFCPLFNVSILVVISAWFSPWLLFFFVYIIVIFQYLVTVCSFCNVDRWTELHEKLRVFNNVCSFYCVAQKDHRRSTKKWQCSQPCHGTQHACTGTRLRHLGMQRATSVSMLQDRVTTAQWWFLATGSTGSGCISAHHGRHHRMSSQWQAEIWPYYAGLPQLAVWIVRNYLSWVFRKCPHVHARFAELLSFAQFSAGWPDYFTLHQHWSNLNFAHVFGQTSSHVLSERYIFVKVFPQLSDKKYTCA